MFNVLTIIIIVIALGCLGIRIFFTIKMYKNLLPEIKGPDNNISTNRLDKIIESFKNKLNISDWNVVQDGSNKYYGINNNANFKTKTITISKILVPSVGYELDNILGNIWFASKLIMGDKKLSRILLLVNIFIPLFRILFLSFFSIHIALFCIYKFDNMVIYESKILIFLINNGLTFYLCLICLIILAIFQTIIYGNKADIELSYEKDLSLFVSNECKEFSSDIVAARTYALEWTSLIVPVFSKRVSAVKYLGPFVIFI